jgi:phosphomannomutase
MLDILAQLRKHVVVGFVGGSDLPKQKEQIGENCTLWLISAGAF